MSILTSTADDFNSNRTLPDSLYRVTVLDAKVEQTDNGSRLTRMYGNIRTPDGATEVANGNGQPFRIGNRKLFARSWIDHTNEQAASIGQREIKREAVAAGLMQKPKKGETVELDFESWDSYANALIGREVLVRTKAEKQYEAGGVRVRKPTAEQIASEEVKLVGEEARVVAWVENV